MLHAIHIWAHNTQIRLPYSFWIKLNFSFLFFFFFRVQGGWVSRLEQITFQQFISYWFLLKFCNHSRVKFWVKWKIWCWKNKLTFCGFKDAGKKEKLAQEFSTVFTPVLPARNQVEKELMRSYGNSIFINKSLRPYQILVIILMGG